jgi:hypothetical protein
MKLRNCLYCTAAVSVRRIAGAVTPFEQRAYLRAEHKRLRAEHLRLISEFDALRATGLSRQELRAQVLRMRAHLNLLENHLIGLEGMRRPPWERSRSSRLFVRRANCEW